MMDQANSKRWLDYYKSVTRTYNITRNSRGFIPHEVRRKIN